MMRNTATATMRPVLPMSTARMSSLSISVAPESGPPKVKKARRPESGDPA
jgi:hypothetical protein